MRSRRGRGGGCRLRARGAARQQKPPVPARQRKPCAGLSVPAPPALPGFSARFSGVFLRPRPPTATTGRKCPSAPRPPPAPCGSSRDEAGTSHRPRSQKGRSRGENPPRPAPGHPSLTRPVLGHPSLTRPVPGRPYPTEHVLGQLCPPRPCSGRFSAECARSAEFPRDKARKPPPGERRRAARARQAQKTEKPEAGGRGIFPGR